MPPEWNRRPPPPGSQRQYGHQPGYGPGQYPAGYVPPVQQGPGWAPMGAAPAPSPAVAEKHTAKMAILQWFALAMAVLQKTGLGGIVAVAVSAMLGTLILVQHRPGRVLAIV